jgi:hypothetical protein
MKMDTVSTEPLPCSAEPLPRPTELESRAAEALAALLGRISAIKLLDPIRFLEMKCESWPDGRSSGTLSHRIQARPISAHPIQTSPIQTSPIQACRIPTRTIIAQIDVYGHRHTLACEVYPDGDPGRLRAAFRQSQRVAQPISSDATPVLIAPYLSPEAQDLCKQSKGGFLDFEGNARLTVGEVFIVMRSLPGNSAAPRNSAIDWSAVAHASPALPIPISIAPISIIPSALPVPSALPTISRNRVGSVAIPA